MICRFGGHCFCMTDSVIREYSGHSWTCSNRPEEGPELRLVKAKQELISASVYLNEFCLFTGSLTNIGTRQRMTGGRAPAEVYSMVIDAVWKSAVQHSILQYSTVQYLIGRYRYSIVKFGTISVYKEYILHGATECTVHLQCSRICRYLQCSLVRCCRA